MRARFLRCDAGAVAHVVVALSLLAVAVAPLPVWAAGEPVEGLSPAHLAWFTEGLTAFERNYAVEDGLGPVYNATSCVACHSMPEPGGGSGIAITRFGRVDGPTYSGLATLGGPLLQEFAIDDACVETIPAQANVTAQRITTPIFGAGLIEAIPDQSLVALSDPDDRDGDGISGRVHMVPYPGSPRVGRFGWKSHEATLLSFSSEAMATEMGVTNALTPQSPAPNGSSELLEACEALEGKEDPEDDVASSGGGFSALVKVTNFSRLLAPPTPQERPRGRGWRLFRRTGCNDCHVSRHTTGSHTIPALAHRTFYPYSDFLLHDMGALGDGIVHGAASANEMRSAPLWGIAGRDSYLHDGRALTLEGAILAHDGEGAAARDAYDRLGPDRARVLLEFVGSR